MRGARCFDVREALGGHRVFGLWANLYSLRGRADRDVGVGTFAELHELVRFAGEVGAAFVGLSPLHALRNHPPDVSPYSPSSRLFRNPLYLDVRAVPELEHAPEARALLEGAAFRDEAARLAREPRIDYAAVQALRRPVLEALHRAFRALPDAAPRRRDYAAFRARGGARLLDFATFCALEEEQVARGGSRDRRGWPEALGAPDREGVRAFRAAHPGAVDFHAWLQLEADRQLAAAARAAREAGLAVGLYTDLALGSAASGFDAWAFPDVFADEANAGAPPDAYAAEGQDWGFPPPRPEALVESAYPRLLFESGFGHAGALRIDHVMGLFRLWWVPRDRSPREGAYVAYPARELLDQLAAASRRHRALVVGEDLGTVPPGLPARLARHGILSSRVMLFERDRAGRFRRAARYSPRALVTANTHDLPTLPAWWSGADLSLRAELGLVADLEAARRERHRDRSELARRLALEGCLPRGVGEPEDLDAATLCAAVHAFLARTPAPLVGVSLDDLAGEITPVNVPGVPTERWPSWTRRMRRSVAELGDDPDVARMLAGLAGRRKSG